MFVCLTDLLSFAIMHVIILVYLDFSNVVEVNGEEYFDCKKLYGSHKVMIKKKKINEELGNLSFKENYFSKR